MRSGTRLERISALALAALALLLQFSPLAGAQDTANPGSVTAEVTVEAAPPTVSFELYSDSSYSNPTASITPQTPVYMRITVQTDNYLSEFKIEGHIFAGDDSAISESPPAQTNSSSYVNFTIYYDPASGWVLDTDYGGSTSWSITFDPNQQLPDPSASSGDFYLVIVFGKTALEANTGDSAPAGDWEIVVKAYYVGDPSISGSDSKWGYTVYFYSEVEPGAQTISFGSLQPRSTATIQQVDGQAASSFTISVLANGYYNLTATADPTWSTSDGYSMSLTTSTPGTGQFRLLIDDESSDGATPLNGVPVAPDLASAEEFVGNLAPTVNEQAVSATIYMQIELGTNIHTGTYSGSVYIYAVDAG